MGYGKEVADVAQTPSRRDRETFRSPVDERDTVCWRTFEEIGKLIGLIYQTIKSYLGYFQEVSYS